MRRKKIYFIPLKKVYIFVLVVVIMTVCIFSYFRYSMTKSVFNPKDELFYKGTSNDNTIALTCNVDWGEEHIPTMLNILKQKDLKITFFVTGMWAKKNPQVLKSIYNEGHEIGNHGYFHEKYGNMSYEQNIKEIKKAENIIEDIIGIKPKFFAPPSGHYSNNTIKAANKLDYKVIMWSIDTIDWRKGSTKNVIVQRVLKKACNSGIVLMHPKPETIKALPTIIDQLKARGYKLGNVSDVLK
ncbi:polysaccharide deacetylase family protein [Clostridiaceae bacterium M8S5]|nr:polysaccharide deacetylase family protein [Clostridiaceae bacterium M8S5]